MAPSVRTGVSAGRYPGGEPFALGLKPLPITSVPYVAGFSGAIVPWGVSVPDLVPTRAEDTRVPGKIGASPIDPAFGFPVG
jgi:hypothetical protein